MCHSGGLLRPDDSRDDIGGAVWTHREAVTDLRGVEGSGRLTEAVRRHNSRWNALRLIDRLDLVVPECVFEYDRDADQQRGPRARVWQFRVGTVAVQGQAYRRLSKLFMRLRSSRAMLRVSR